MPKPRSGHTGKIETEADYARRGFVTVKVRVQSIVKDRLVELCREHDKSQAEIIGRLILGEPLDDPAHC